MAEELHFVPQEVALAGLQFQTVLPESIEDDFQSLTMGVKVIGKDYDVIQIDEQRLKRQIAKHHAHEALERSWGVA